MITGSDTMVLVRLLADSQPWTYRSLSKELGLDSAALHRSTGRLKKARLLAEDRRANRSAAEEFLIHAVPYLFPAEPGSMGPGLPTAWGASPLNRLIVGDGEPLPVWPDALGEARGLMVDPIAGGVVELSKSDPRLYEWFALIDGIRIGRARERKLAAKELRARIWGEPTDES